MDLVWDFGWLVAGFVLLYFGAEWLVKGSSEIALKLGLSPLVVALTVVAFGTSAPELLVSVQAGLRDQGDIALGNVVGSNICNIALILGAGALVRPVVIHAQIIKREMPVLLAISIVFVWFLWDGRVQRWEGGVLFAGIIAYVWASFHAAKREPHPEQFEAFEAEELQAIRKGGAGRLVLDVALIVAGLAALIFGADRLVVSGVSLAERFGVPEAIIALTLVAFGTSLPELATALVASVRNQGDIISGNAIGSCIFNILAVVGLASLVTPLVARDLNRIDLWVMLGLTFLIIPFMWSRMRLSRAEGAILLAGYLGYCGYLVARGGS
ncbi:MAG: calcium/sodium antiporter [Akkermansiaceae bacterium]|nr:calcium/sodium antiporter [Akkermansiaceae bacterium]